MGWTNNETQVQWSAANSLSIASGATGTSDAFTIDQTCITLGITCKVDNDGAPASGDTVDFYLLSGTYDPDGSGAVEYGTTVQDIWLARLDTSVTDPSQTTVFLPCAITGGKIYCKNNSGGRAQTVSVTILEKRFA